MPRQQLTVTLCCLSLIVSFTLLVPTWAVDDAHWTQADQAIRSGIAHLRQTQNKDGSWSPQPGPAITAMVLAVLLDHPDTPLSDPTVQKALTYILSKAKPDGAIHDGFLENYNTAICLAALARLNDHPEAHKAIQKGQAYLRHLQWHDQLDPQDNAIDAAHPYYGGAGYGKHGRPDLSNTQIMLEGLYETGMDCNDPVFIRALAFITRCQGTPMNTEFGDKITQDGGFIYATSINKDLIGIPQSMGSPELIDEAKQGKPVSGLRTYGSMTYAGFKSYLYANLDRDDPRVRHALSWIQNNYTLDHNPGMPEPQKMQGHYYYLMTFSKALAAWGSEQITTADGVQHHWAHDLIDQLAKTQNKDGSWTNPADRWLEGDTNLTTAYALTALTYAIK